MSTAAKRARLLRTAGATGEAPHDHSLRATVESCLERYFADLDGHAPGQVFEMVMNEVEPAMLRTVLRHTGGNQSRAADILGINRSTLRKKIRHYGIEIS